MTFTRINGISDAALTVLKTATCDGNQIKLNSPKLDRGLYLEVNEVLERLGGKWKGGKIAAHQFLFDPEPLFQAVLQTGILPAKNPLAFFPTPAPVVEQMLSFAGDLSGKRVLEPSAGLGAIAEAVRSSFPSANIDCVEIDEFRASILKAKGFTVFCDDFLTVTKPFYDAILMNPPFIVDGDKSADLTHIQHAYDLLALGGKLVAIASPGFTFREQKKYIAFREFVEAHGEWSEVNAGAFKESGTNIRTIILWMEKAK